MAYLVGAIATRRYGVWAETTKKRRGGGTETMQNLNTEKFGLLAEILKKPLMAPHIPERATAHVGKKCP